MKKLIPILLLFCVVASTQTAVLMPLPRYFAVDALGKPFAAGCVWTYAAGTTSPLASYSDASGTPNRDPVVLGSDGAADIWLGTGQAYKIALYSAGPNPNSTCSTGSLIRTTDNVTGLATQITNSFAAVTAVPYSTTPVFTSLAQNQLFTMTLTGNVTSSSLVMSGIAVPAWVTFQLTQDATGSRNFSFPPNTSGSIPISGSPNATTIETFYWNGTVATNLGTLQSVTSVFGRTGAISAQNGDYSCAQVTGCSSGGGAAGGLGTSVGAPSVNAATTNFQMLTTLSTQAPNFYNGVGKSVHEHAAGKITGTDGSASAEISMCLQLGAGIPSALGGQYASIQGPITATMFWNQDIDCTVATAGASSSWKCSMTTHNQHNFVTFDTVTAIDDSGGTGSPDLTQTLGIGPCIKFSTSSASNVAQLIEANAQETN